MDSSQTTIHSIIVKVWRTDLRTGANPPLEHGHVTHVASGARVYAQNPNQLPLRVTAQLRETGVPLALCWRLKLSLREWSRRWTRKQ